MKVNEKATISQRLQKAEKGKRKILNPPYKRNYDIVEGLLVFN